MVPDAVDPAPTAASTPSPDPRRQVPDLGTVAAQSSAVENGAEESPPRPTDARPEESRRPGHRAPGRPAHRADPIDEGVTRMARAAGQPVPIAYTDAGARLDDRAERLDDRAERPDEPGTGRQAEPRTDHDQRHDDKHERHNGHGREHSAQVEAKVETKVKATPKHAPAAHRHAGPYGASFDGTAPDASPTRGLTFERRWTRTGVHPYDEITWEIRTANISNETGKTVFEQKDVEVPTFWSQLATNVVVSKYFRGHVGTPEREHSVQQLIDRVVNTIAGLGGDPALLRHRRGPRRLQGRADPPAGPPEDGLQLARSGSTSASRSSRSAPPASSTRSRTRCPRSWTSPRPRRCSSSTARARASTSSPIRGSKERMSGGGIASGPGQLHEGLRRLRRRRQVGRQDPPRGQDGHPRRRPPGRHRVHRLQGQRGEEGLGPHRGRATTRPSPARRTARSSSRTPTTRCA